MTDHNAEIALARSAAPEAISRDAEVLVLGRHGYNWMAHLMFHTSFMDAAVWGADLPKSLVMLNPQFNGDPEPIKIFMVPAGRWSNGTPAPVM